MSQLTGRTEYLGRQIGLQLNEGAYRAICRRPNGVLFVRLILVLLF